MDLFGLVKSLNKFEKGYVKKQLASGPGREGEVLSKLLDAIAKQQTYDEAALKAVISQGKSRSHLAVTKHHLYRKILQALGKYGEKRSDLAEMFDQLRCAEVLFQRGRTDEALAFVRDMEEQVRGHEGHEEELLMVSRLRMRIMAARRDFCMDLPARLREVEDQEQSLEKIRNTLSHWRLFCETEHLSLLQGRRPHADSRQRLLALLEGHLLRDESSALTPLAKVVRHETLLRVHLLLGNGEPFRETAHLLLGELEKPGHPLGQDWIRAISVTSLMAHCQVMLQQYGGALEWVVRQEAKMEEMQMSDEIKVRYSRSTFDIEMLCYCRLGLTGELRRRMAQVLTPQGLLPSNMNDWVRPMLTANVAWGHLLLGNLRACGLCLQDIFAFPYKDVLFDVHQKARIIQFCAVAQQGDTELLHSLAESYRKFVSTRKEPNSFDKALVRFFKNYPALDGGRHEEFAQCLRQLLVCPEVEVAGIHYFPVHLWAEAQARRITLAEASAKEYGGVEEAVLNQLHVMPRPAFTRRRGTEARPAKAKKVRQQA